MVSRVTALLGLLLLCVATQAEFLDFGSDLMGAYALGGGLGRSFYGGGGMGAMGFPGAYGGGFGAFPGMNPYMGGYYPRMMAPTMPYALGK